MTNFLEDAAAPILAVAVLLIIVSIIIYSTGEDEIPQPKSENEKMQQLLDYIDRDIKQTTLLKRGSK